MQNTVLITGASSGVGLSLARHLAGRYRVVAAARRVDKIKQELGDLDVDIVGVDLSSAAETSQMIEDVLERYGFVGYAINNAGVNLRGAIADIDQETLMRSFSVNALAPFLIMKHLLPSMAERNFGRIINVTSGAPLNCFPGFSSYSASKGALNAITVTAAGEYATNNIKINLMSPGPVRSEMSPTAPMDPEVCHSTADYLLELGQDGPTGRFFWLGREIPLFPDLSGIQWLEGTASDRFPKVL